MTIDKENAQNKFELAGFLFVYLVLFTNAFITNDSPIALVSAFCGITYTILAGKGIPSCYLIGVVGSAFYAYLSFVNALWGNLTLYAGYYIPMQILGFFQWNKHLKSDKKEIIKIRLTNKERIRLILVGFVLSTVLVSCLYYFNDKSPVIDGITTVFSILGMYLTVKRTIEQWVVWMVVNGLSFIMWAKIALSGERVISTVIMWGVYFTLAVYFYFVWRRELNREMQ